MYIADMENGVRAEGFYLLSGAVSRISNNGRPYLSMTLQDVSGTIDGKVWDYGGPVGEADVGKVVKLRGQVSEYRGQLQFTVERIRLAGEQDEYAPEDLVPAAPLDADAAFEELKEIVGSIEDADYAAVANEMLRRHADRLRDIPAAKSVHHAFLHGLLMHTLNMLRLADTLAALYYDTVDRSLLLTGTLCHDLAKESEFVFSPMGLAVDYSVKGQLLGHLVMGAQEAAEVCRTLDTPEEKSVLLQHMILSHHGEPEFGAAVVPQCAESELLSYIDLIDSRMEIYRETLAELNPGQFSPRVFALEHKVYRHG